MGPRSGREGAERGGLMVFGSGVAEREGWYSKRLSVRFWVGVFLVCFWCVSCVWGLGAGTEGLGQRGWIAARGPRTGVLTCLRLYRGFFHFLSSCFFIF